MSTPLRIDNFARYVLQDIERVVKEADQNHDGLIDAQELPTLGTYRDELSSMFTQFTTTAVLLNVRGSVVKMQNTGIVPMSFTPLALRYSKHEPETITLIEQCQKYFAVHIPAWSASECAQEAVALALKACWTPCASPAGVPPSSSARKTTVDPPHPLAGELYLQLDSNGRLVAISRQSHPGTAASLIWQKP